ncbi:MAG: hypothetical protein Q4D02_02565 [Clostridia bacterium]|nr:hypothetical protein [Clostridia bacterium]
MSCTIYYKGKLKKRYNPTDVFNKIIENTRWRYEMKNEYFFTVIINLKSEPLNFHFQNSCIDDFCKVHVEDDKEYDRILELFFSIRNMFSQLEIQDDLGLWNDYLAKRNSCKIKLRELSEDEIKVIEKFDDQNSTSKNVLLRIIASSIRKDKNDIITYQYLIDHINPNITGYHFASMKGLELYGILETWIYETMTYQNCGRVSDIDKTTKGLQSSINAFTFGIAETLFGIYGGSTGDKQAKIRKFYHQEIVSKNVEIEKDSVLMYQYVVSILEYLGFQFVGRKKEDRK